MKAWKGYMRGINLGGWISQCPHEQSHYDSFISEKNIQAIASWGSTISACRSTMT